MQKIIKCQFNIDICSIFHDLLAEAWPETAGPAALRSGAFAAVLNEGREEGKCSRGIWSRIAAREHIAPCYTTSHMYCSVITPLIHTVYQVNSNK